MGSRWRRARSAASRAPGAGGGSFRRGGSGRRPHRADHIVERPRAARLAGPVVQAVLADNREVLVQQLAVGLAFGHPATDRLDVGLSGLTTMWRVDLGRWAWRNGRCGRRSRAGGSLTCPDGRARPRGRSGPRSSRRCCWARCPPRRAGSPPSGWPARGSSDARSRARGHHRSVAAPALSNSTDVVDLTGAKARDIDLAGSSWPACRAADRGRRQPRPQRVRMRRAGGAQRRAHRRGTRPARRSPDAPGAVAFLGNRLTIDDDLVALRSQRRRGVPAGRRPHRRERAVHRGALRNEGGYALYGRTCRPAPGF